MDENSKWAAAAAANLRGIIHDLGITKYDIAALVIIAFVIFLVFRHGSTYLSRRNERLEIEHRHHREMTKLNAELELKRQRARVKAGGTR